jgi:hypothetical protein
MSLVHITEVITISSFIKANCSCSSLSRGKPIYKKTVKFDTIPSTGEIDLTSHFQDVETIVSNQMFTEWYNMDVAFAGNQYRGKAFITVQPEMAKIEYVPNIDYDYSMINSFTLTLEYTKRTV